MSYAGGYHRTALCIPAKMESVAGWGRRCLPGARHFGRSGVSADDHLHRQSSVGSSRVLVTGQCTLESPCFIPSVLGEGQETPHQASSLGRIGQDLRGSRGSHYGG